MGDRAVSDPWIHVFDGATVSLDELDRLRARVLASWDSAREVAESLSRALGVITGSAWWAPLHGTRAVWAVGESLSAVVGMGQELELLEENLALARELYAEAQFTVARVVAQYWAQRVLVPVPESLAAPLAVAGVACGAVAVAQADGPPVARVQRELRAAAALAVQAVPKVRGTHGQGPVQDAAARMLAASGQDVVRGAVVLEEARVLTASGLDSAQAVLEQLQEAAAESDSSGRGEIRVVEQVNAAGQRAFTVVLPGTREMWNAANPQDHLSNVQLMAGTRSDLLDAVLQALDLAGIGQDDPVVLVGHSQGGIVAAELAADSEFLARYQVRGVLTLGSPVGHVRLPDGVISLHLENMQDVVPALDGIANSADRRHVTVVRDGGGHSVADYSVTLAAAMGASRSVQRVEGRLAAVAGWGAGGRANVRAYRFERAGGSDDGSNAGKSTG